MLVHGPSSHGCPWSGQLNPSAAHPYARQSEGHHYSLNNLQIPSASCLVRYLFSSWSPAFNFLFSVVVFLSAVDQRFSSPLNVFTYVEKSLWKAGI